jgi:hypothetical protein
MKSNALNLSVLLTLFIAFGILLSSPGLLSLDAFRDSGAASFIGLGLISLGLGICLFLAMDGKRGAPLHWLLLAFVYLVYLMREADFHQAFSSESLTKLDTYSLLEVPLEIRLTAAVVLLSMTGILIYFLFRYSRSIFSSMAKGENWAIALLLWFLLLLCSQIFDRSISTSGTHWKLTAIEELLEVSAALFAVLAIIQFAFFARITQNTRVL